MRNHKYKNERYNALGRSCTTENRIHIARLEYKTISNRTKGCCSFLKLESTKTHNNVIIFYYKPENLKVLFVV